MRLKASKIQKLLEQAFPDDQYYTQNISYETVFEGTRFYELIRDLAADSDLAKCLHSLPDALVLCRNLLPEDGSLLVIFFDDEIKLDEHDTRIYQQFFPESLLLYAPEHSQHIWFKDYVAGKSPIKEPFSLES